jgi:hypothetical protein
MVKNERWLKNQRKDKMQTGNHIAEFKEYAFQRLKLWTKAFADGKTASPVPTSSWSSGRYFNALCCCHVHICCRMICWKAVI